jgi:hypothetical protein
MSDDQRFYSDDEFALILRKAAELAHPSEPAGHSPGGLTLAEIKAAAAEAGFDPALVERAARLLADRVIASPTARLIGGPLRHEHKLRFPITLDEEISARLLSAVRISAGEFGRANGGHSSSMGMTWRDGGEMEALSVTAHPEEEGTSVSVVLDRRGTMVTVAFVSGLVMFFTVLFSVFALYPEAPALGYGGLIAGIGTALAAARGYWASSTRKVRERIGVVMGAIDKTLTRPEEAGASGFGAIGDGAGDSGADASGMGNAEHDSSPGS